VSVKAGRGARHALIALAAKEEALPSPTEAYFEVANRCNSLCATCPVTFAPHEPAKLLSFEEFRRIADSLPQLKRAVMHGIGEPLLNPHLPAMIAYLKQRDVHVVFNTNAILLSRKRQAALIRSGLDELRVSLDGSTPETYARIRGVPQFRRVLRNVRQLVRTRNELGVSTPRVALWMTGMRENLAELPSLVRLAARLGVEEVYLQRLTYWGEGLAVEEQRVFRRDEEAIDLLIAEAARLATELGVDFQGSGAGSPLEHVASACRDAEPWRACSRPLRLAYITANGNALPCCIAPFTDAPYGEITLGNYLQEGVAAVWGGEKYQAFRARLYSSDPPKSCRNCGLAWSL
jgi:MoaA/NifB/PqqE/SkfB family radical SAM enzyme